MTREYDDIINLPRHISKNRQAMSNKDRAAQFSPFAALTGHYEEVREAARVTEERVELDEYMKESLNYELQILANNIAKQPEINITYFKPDDKKEGGSYITIKGKLKKINQYKKYILLNEDIVIPIKEIIKIDSKIMEI